MYSIQITSKKTCQRCTATTKSGQRCKNRCQATAAAAPLGPYRLRRSAQRLTARAARAARGWGDSSGGGGRLDGPASAQGGQKRSPTAAAALQAPQAGCQRGSRSMSAISVRIRALRHQPSSVPSLHGENIESLALSLAQG